MNITPILKVKLDREQFIARKLKFFGSFTNPDYKI